MKKKCILSDMGGVLVDLNWESSAKQLLPFTYSLEELMGEWIKMKPNILFETGKIEFDEYAFMLKKEFNIAKSIEEIKNIFMSILVGPKPSFFDVFERLKNNFELAVLSNTTKAHIDYIKQKYDMFKNCSYTFFSYEVGHMKPGKEIFDVACNRINIPREDILFFDDYEVNVKAAIKFGLKNSFLVNSPEEIEEISSSYIAN